MGKVRITGTVINTVTSKFDHLLDKLDLLPVNTVESGERRLRVALSHSNLNVLPHWTIHRIEFDWTHIYVTSRSADLINDFLIQYKLSESGEMSQTLAEMAHMDLKTNRCDRRKLEYLLQSKHGRYFVRMPYSTIGEHVWTPETDARFYLFSDFTKLHHLDDELFSIQFSAGVSVVLDDDGYTPRSKRHIHGWTIEEESTISPR